MRGSVRLPDADLFWIIPWSGMLKNKFGNAMFKRLLNGKLERVVCCYVDDFVLKGCINLGEQIINIVKETFSATSQESERSKYLGLYTDQKYDVITFHQYHV